MRGWARRKWPIDFGVGVRFKVALMECLFVYNLVLKYFAVLHLLARLTIGKETQECFD
jgi:hypothetical protein